MSDLSFYCNGFVIIDLVPDGELQTGRKLEEQIQDIVLYEKKTGLFCHRYRCHTKQELNEVFEDVKKHLQRTGEVPLIHVDGHASKESLKLLDGTSVSWKEVFSSFKEINILCANNLFFTCGACDSAFALQSIASITEPCPVYGLLAPEVEVSAGDMSDAFIEFYKHFIRTEDIGHALDEFATKTNPKQYALIFSPMLFQKVAYVHIKENSIGTSRRQRIEDLVSEVVNTCGVPLKEARKAVKDALSREPEILNKLHSKFMLIDHHPQNGARFTFDAVEFVKQVRQGEVHFD